MSTADIIAVLRREAEWWYHAAWSMRGRDGNHVRADALRRAAKRLARLEDDALMREYASIYIPAAIMLPAYRAVLGVCRA